MSWSGLARLATAAALALSAAVAAPAAAQAAQPIGGGTPILVGGTAGCTITAAGYDATGTAVAFTAGHCSTHPESEPILLRDAKQLGPVGWVVARNNGLDYSVIRLDRSKVSPVRQIGVTGTGGVPNLGDVVCKDGYSTGHTCGITWQNEGPRFWSQTCAGFGDSGGPVTRDGRLVGLLSGGHMPPAAGPVGSIGPLLPSCVHPAQSPFFLPAVATSFEAITADATERGWPGRGFRMA